MHTIVVCSCFVKFASIYFEKENTCIDLKAASEEDHTVKTWLQINL